MELDRIKFERTGGFAGLRIRADFELNDLNDEQIRRLTDLLDELDFAGLPERLSPNSEAPDEFTYTITVESKKWSHTVITGDSSADEKMQELLEILNRLARKKMRKH